MSASAMETKKTTLLKIATEKIEREGYKRFKIADFAKAASVSMSTVYTLFESKEELYLMYIKSKIDEMFNTIETFETDDPHLRIEHYISVIFALAQQGKNILKDGVTDNPLFFTAHSNQFSKSAERLYTYLASCILEINPSLDETEAYRLGCGFNGLLHGYLHCWVTVGGDVDTIRSEVYDRFICMATSCIQSKEG